MKGVLWLKGVLCVPGWGGEPGGDGEWGGLWLWFVPAGEWGRGGCVRGGGACFGSVLAWGGGRRLEVLWGESRGLWFCGGVEPPFKPQMHRSPSHTPMRVWGAAVHLWLGRRPEVVVL